MMHERFHQPTVNRFYNGTEEKKKRTTESSVRCDSHRERERPSITIPNSGLETTNKKRVDRNEWAFEILSVLTEEHSLEGKGDRFRIRNDTIDDKPNSLWGYEYRRTEIELFARRSKDSWTHGKNNLSFLECVTWPTLDWLGSRQANICWLLFVNFVNMCFRTLERTGWAITATSVFCWLLWALIFDCSSNTV